jgi:hypothetical protein
MLTGLQIRTARKLLGWGVWRLAHKGGIARSAIVRAESTEGEAPITLYQHHQIQRALETAGIEFIAENGAEPRVRLRKVP